MSRVTNRRPKAWPFILLTAAGLATAALAFAQPSGLGSDAASKAPSLHGDPNHRDGTVSLAALHLDRASGGPIATGQAVVSWTDLVLFPIGTDPGLESLGASTLEPRVQTVADGAPDRYDYILEWMKMPITNRDPAPGGLARPSGDRGGTAASETLDNDLAGNDGRVLDADELELMGTRTQALLALRELVQRRRAEFGTRATPNALDARAKETKR